jgi:hypothetical protein
MSKFSSKTASECRQAGHFEIGGRGNHDFADGEAVRAG